MRFEIEFEYYDKYCRAGQWNKQSCSLVAESERDAIAQCIRIYGLGIDCDYRILSVKRVA